MPSNAECGMRNAECAGLSPSPFRIPHSAFRTPQSPFRIVVIGASRGGLRALRTVLAGLPVDLGVPTAIVLHRGGSDTDDGLVQALRGESPLPVSEPDDKDPIVPGRVCVAPAGYHLLVDGNAFALSTEGRVGWSRPSVDALFETAAWSYGEGVLGVVLTGASADGAAGAAEIKRRGGAVIVQDPATAEADEMPRAVVAGGPVDHVVPLGEIPALIARLCRAEPR